MGMCVCTPQLTCTWLLRWVAFFERCSTNPFIHSMQGSICTELIQRLGEYRPHLNRAVAVAAEVDCLMSLALAAREHHYTRPILTKDNVLHIKQGESHTGYNAPDWRSGIAWRRSACSQAGTAEELENGVTMTSTMCRGCVSV